MPWYVFALSDERPRAAAGVGLGGALTARAVPGGFAIVERRADVPPVEFGTLRTHDAVVARVADMVPAILPVRFGTLVELEDLEEMLTDREAEISEALDRVRGRVQFTWRGPASVRGRARAGRPAKSGTDYLRRAARSASGVPPAPFRRLRDAFGSLIAAQRYQAAAGVIPESLYHLVNRTDGARYMRLARKASVDGSLSVKGPFPPFAFTPELI
ncbi:MAG TPA: GvpL/GvpF family gas vesicle protein [Vicinamibacterales bacterium]